MGFGERESDKRVANQPNQSNTNQNKTRQHTAKKINSYTMLYVLYLRPSLSTPRRKYAMSNMGKKRVLSATGNHFQRQCHNKVSTTAVKI